MLVTIQDSQHALKPNQMKTTLFNLMLLLFVLPTTWGQNANFSTNESLTANDHFSTNLIEGHEKGFIGHDYGRVYDFVYDDKGNAYAGSMSNQILLSEDGGHSWDILFSFPDNRYAIKDITFHKINDNEYLYFTAGVKGSNPLNALYVLDLKTLELVNEIHVPTMKPIKYYTIDPKDYNRVLLLTSGGNGITEDNFNRIYLTEDNGESMIVIRDRSDLNYQTQSISFDPTIDGRIYVSLGNPGGMLISEDLGKTYSDVMMDEHVMRFVEPHPEKEGLVFAATGINFGGTEGEILYRSEDHGETWEEVNLDLVEGSLNTFLKMDFDPSRPQTIYLTEEKSIYKTMDFGKTWEAQHYDDWSDYYYGIDVAVNPTDSRNVIVSAELGLIVSDNSGKTWEHVNMPYQAIDNLAHVTYPSGDQYLYYSSISGYFVENLTTGEHFEDVELGTFGFTHYFLPDPNVEGRVIIARTNQIGQVLYYLSNDYGKTLELIANEFGEYIWDMKVDPNVPNRYWIAQRINLPTSKLIRMTLNDNVADVEVVPVNENFEGQITSVELVEGEKDLVFASVETDIKKSTDDGNTWMVLSEELPFAGVWDITINPHNTDHIIASLSLDEGLFVSHNGGASWDANFTGYEMHDVSFIPGKEDAVVSRRFGFAGLILSQDGGDTWYEIPEDDMHYISGTGFDFVETKQGVEMYLPTYDMGIMTIKLPWSDFSRGVASTKQADFYDQEEDQWVNFRTNRVNEKVELEFNDMTAAKMSLYSIEGKMISTSKVNSDRAVMGMSSQNSGYYIMKVEAEDGRVWSDRFYKD